MPTEAPLGIFEAFVSRREGPAEILAVREDREMNKLTTRVVTGFALAAVSLLSGSTPLHAQGVDDEERAKQDLPLAGWNQNRTINIDMTEGSWISLDVSPDGQTIVYDLLGDLYTIPIGGGDAQQLTAAWGWTPSRSFHPTASGSRSSLTWTAVRIFM